MVAGHMPGASRPFLSAKANIPQVSQVEAFSAHLTHALVWAALATAASNGKKIGKVRGAWGRPLLCARTGATETEVGQQILHLGDVAAEERRRWARRHMQSMSQLRVDLKLMMSM
jgi:hypothetical protein